MVVKALGADLSAAHALTIFSIAWLLGTALPGASAGIGVREAVIIGLGQLMAGADLALSAILLRALTVIADVELWAVSNAVPKMLEQLESFDSR